MRNIRIDREYSFYSAFNQKTGAYLRSGIIRNGMDSGEDPFMASFPHLVDVGIMGHCAHGKSGLCKIAGIGCYQSGAVIERPDMKIADFAEIVSQCAGKVDQFALGGRGDPDMHEHFEDILRLCRDNHIVPNFTTSGYGLTDRSALLCKKYCGAVAVSWYRNEHTKKAIRMLLDAGVKTNIHYVLAKNTIDEAVDLFQNDGFPKGINAVLFLLHKPVGLGEAENVLDFGDPRVKLFFDLLDRGSKSVKIGIDSCTTPGVINYCKNVDIQSVDTCEGGRFSCYITSDMIMLPCSFDQELKYAVSLRERTMKEAWDGKEFSDFRSIMSDACPKCDDRAACLGGCPLIPELVFCDREERT